MLVANSFDLWQKDAFFSAAEEVQQSADIMESAYRMWLKARREGLLPKYLDELTGELQMALGTAKWQLEEFEKAVRLSYRNKGDDITVTRHKQFVSAIEDQISRVETALKESFNVEGKKPFRWVNLDEKECDDLALFLSGTPPETSQRIKDENLKLGPVMTSSSYMNNSTREDCSLGSEASSKIQVPNHMKSLDILTSSEDGNCCMVFEDGKISEMGNEISYQGDKMSSNRRTRTSPERLEIVIDSDDRQPNAVIEATPKEKGSKPFFWRSRDEYYPGSRAVLSRTQLKISSWMNQLRGCQRSQRLHQISPVLPVNSMRFVLALMLTIFLVGMLFLWYLVLLCTS